MQTGTVKCWGSNVYGQVGFAGVPSAPTPFDVPGLSGISAIAAGANQSFALDSSGAVYAWGNNAGGQLGLGNARDVLTPREVRGL